jgi:iron(III) transport system ATP-binding protein
MAEVRIDTMTISLPANGNNPGVAKLAVRPSRIQLYDASEPNTISGTVLKATYAGSHMEYQVDTPVGEIFVVSDVESNYQKNTAVSLGFMRKGPVLLPKA